MPSNKENFRHYFRHGENYFCHFLNYRLFRSGNGHAHARDFTMAAAGRAFGPEPGCARYNIDILWMDERLRAGWPRPRQQCLKWGLTDSAPPTGSCTAVGGGAVSGVVTVSQLMQPCDSNLSDSKSQMRKWSTSNKRKAKGTDLQIVTPCNSNCIFCRKCCIITIYTSLQPWLSWRLSRIFFRPAANSAAYRFSCAVD